MANKYGNKKVEYQGIKFDSEDELAYYKFLLDMQSKGILKIIELQPKIELLPKFTKHGKKYQAITYTPDFLVEYDDGRKVYIDYKGFESQQGILRRKMFAYACDHELIWITKSKKYSDTGFINYDTLKKLRSDNKKKKEGVKPLTLSEIFGVSRATISDIKLNKHWTHVE